MSVKFDAYVAARWRGRRRPLTHPVPFPLVAALGIAGEVGEVVEHLKKHYRDGKHPGVALKLELGDVLHYLTVIAGSYGWTLDQIAADNVEKLRARDEARGHVVP